MQKLFYLFIAATTVVYGQATYGTIFGTVSDSSRAAAMADVNITVISQDRGVAFAASTNESGNYSKTQLPAGPYQVEFVKPGFQRVMQKDVAVSVDRATQLGLRFEF